MKWGKEQRLQRSSLAHFTCAVCIHYFSFVVTWPPLFIIPSSRVVDAAADHIFMYAYSYYRHYKLYEYAMKAKVLMSFDQIDLNGIEEVKTFPSLSEGIHIEQGDDEAAPMEMGRREE